MDRPYMLYSETVKQFHFVPFYFFSWSISVRLKLFHWHSPIWLAGADMSGERRRIGLSGEDDGVARGGVFNGSGSRWGYWHSHGLHNDAISTVAQRPGDCVWCSALIKYLAISRYATRYDTICCSNVRSKADMSRLNLPHGNDNCKTEKLKSKNRYVRSNSKSLGNHVVSSEEEEEERLQWEGFA